MAKRTVLMDEAKDLFQVFDYELFKYTTAQLIKYGYEIKLRVIDGYGRDPKDPVYLNNRRKEQIVAIKKKDELRFVAEAWAWTPEKTRTGQVIYPFGDDSVQYQFQAKKRSTGAGYIILLFTRFSDDDLPLFEERLTVKNTSLGGEVVASSKAIEFFNDYKNIVVSITETGNQEPRTFKSTTHSPHHDFIKATNQIKMARVVSIVSIEKGFNTVNIERSRIQEPGTECWFLIDCEGYRGATFNIITDGERFHPVSRVNRQSRRVKIEKDVGKATVNADSMNATDKELIHMAIKGWIAKI